MNFHYKLILCICSIFYAEVFSILRSSNPKDLKGQGSSQSKFFKQGPSMAPSLPLLLILVLLASQGEAGAAAEIGLIKKLLSAIFDR